MNIVELVKSVKRPVVILRQYSHAQNFFFPDFSVNTSKNGQEKYFLVLGDVNQYLNK